MLLRDRLVEWIGGEGAHLRRFGEAPRHEVRVAEDVEVRVLPIQALGEHGLVMGAWLRLVVEVLERSHPHGDIGRVRLRDLANATKDDDAPIEVREEVHRIEVHRHLDELSAVLLGEPEEATRDHGRQPRLDQWFVRMHVLDPDRLVAPEELRDALIGLGHVEHAEIDVEREAGELLLFHFASYVPIFAKWCGQLMSTGANVAGGGRSPLDLMIFLGSSTLGSG